MYEVKQYNPKIFLYSNGKDQVIYQFDNYDHFLDWVTYDFVAHNIVDDFKKYFNSRYYNVLGVLDIKTGRFGEIRPTKYIVRDEFGSVIHTNEIFHDLEIKREIRREELDKDEKLWTYTFDKNSWKHRQVHYYEYRKDPVPRTACRRGGGKYYRKPKTTQELRRNQNEKEFSRGKRRKDLLPNAWDDIIPSDLTERSWKHYRKTQWRER